jgi:nucleotide-binding universal stress UspA family protein
LLALSVTEVERALRTGLEMGDCLRGLRKAAEAVRRESAHELRDVPNAASRVTDGRPADVLLASVRARGADLLAIGAGRRNRTLGFTFGSTATRLARECPCSVLVARGEIDLERFPERIVVGVDGSAHAADAEAVGRALAQSFGCELHRVLATGGERLNPTSLIDVDDVVPRSPVAALVDASHDSDLVVVGSQGFRGLKALGSVAERLAHRAACPVLIARLR